MWYFYHFSYNWRVIYHKSSSITFFIDCHGQFPIFLLQFDEVLIQLVNLFIFIFDSDLKIIEIDFQTLQSFFQHFVVYFQFFDDFFFFLERLHAVLFLKGLVTEYEALFGEMFKLLVRLPLLKSNFAEIL